MNYKVVMLTGAPATGKSTLSLTLQNRVPRLKSIDYGSLLLSDKQQHNPSLTAEDWSKTKYHDNDPKLSSSVERKNEPFSYLQIVDLDYRNEGGRAWKVIDSHGHLFDLREEILQEIIVNFGIGQNGRVSGSFIWITQGSQIKLVVYGGETYSKEVKEIAKKKTFAKSVIKKEDLAIGHIYEKDEYSKFIYAGKVKVQKYEKNYRYQLTVEPSDNKWYVKHLFFCYSEGILRFPYLVKSVPKFVIDQAAVPENFAGWGTAEYLQSFKDKFKGRPIVFDKDYLALQNGEVA